MHHILYLSRPCAPLSNEELQALLTRARMANSALGITGILFYSPAHFAQLIEGEQHVVTKLYRKIAADPRHDGLMKLADKDIRVRAFATWSMAYVPVSEAGFDMVAGYVSPLHVATPPVQLTAPDKLLYDMVRQMTLPDTSAE